jgi:diguanylate cyclase (GGDEF)-like protein/putative nucleotidyltransferase with HDIG domain
MLPRTKLVIGLVVASAAAATIVASHVPDGSWVRFTVLLAGVLLTSGFKVILPQGEGMMSLNFPFILLAILELSPLQAILLTAGSVLVQCRIRVIKTLTTVQIAFNVANAMTATAAAYGTYTVLARRGMSVGPALALSAGIYFLASTVCVALVIAWSKGEDAFTLWKTQFPWYLPFYLVGAGIATAAHVLWATHGWATSLLLVPLVYVLYRAYTAQMIRIREHKQHLEDTEALHLRTIEGLAMAIEAKDRNTHDHLFRVRDYTTEIGLAFHLSKLEMQALQTASFLHDIGKLAVPEHIINKPGKLTPEEFEKMKIHPVVGADILERVRFPYPVVPIVRSHHEWWNGTGYPDGLKGEDIPIGARILSAVDSFDALTSDRPYRKGLPLREALDIVKSMSGRQFDPAVVDVLEKHFLLREKPVEPVEHHFSPLDTEIDVWRGHAPAVGFEQTGETLEKPAGAGGAGGDRGWEGASANSLNLIAAASQEAQALFEMSQSLGNSLSLNETISVMGSRLRHLIAFQCCALYLKVGDELMLQFVDGEGSQCFSSQPIEVGQGISGWVAQSGKPMLNGNAAVEPSYRARPDQGQPLRAALSIPLLDLNKAIFGVLTLYAVRPDSFSKDHLRILQAMESKLSLSLQNALNYCRVESSAETDFLTGLPNARRLFLQLETELTRCRNLGRQMAVVVCDLNSFKEVNDRHGHLAGNMLLSAIAARFRQSCRPCETVGRMGGDEFVFLIPEIESLNVNARMSEIAEDVIAACSSIHLETQVTASLGVALYPLHAQTSEDLLALADRRMYLDKSLHNDTPTRERSIGTMSVQ